MATILLILAEENVRQTYLVVVNGDQKMLHVERIGDSNVRVSCEAGAWLHVREVRS